VISGEETELDKKVLEGIKTSLIHLLRNCIDHGIEEPEVRGPLVNQGMEPSRSRLPTKAIMW